ncbi:MAG TPA: hypothetical protein VD994_00800, partial [Prosthecobacter sp.]|nr:hypothetical protein [Prosthecobacter sp.]
MNPKFTHSSQVLLSLLAASLLMGTEARAQAASEMRQWTNQQGRAIQAALVRVDGENVVLRLANGTESTVPLANLSQADQAYARVKKTGGAGPVTGGGGALAWPKEVITVDPKTIVVTPGEQNEKARQYHYRSGTFEFIANAPLAGTVMSEVASDFELLRTAFTRLPWGWEPAPREGSHFQIYLTETEEDFIAMGGDERSASGSKNDKNFIRFSAMGLKKVGAKYQYDARQKEPGRAAGMTVRVMAWDFRGRMAPWVLSGLETFMRQLAYQSNGTVKFADLETDLKRYLKEMADNTQPDVPRMLR